jgi:hypothetical protein
LHSAKAELSVIELANGPCIFQKTPIAGVPERS